jgi:tRNA threonylcarbamoyladenosine biosynthesis protein TsaE
MDLNFTVSEIENTASNFLDTIKGKNVIAFTGEMGAGKTTFITAVCKALNVIGTISSPTFSIINQYKTANGGLIYHMDLYRLKNEQEALNAGVEDCLYSGDICLVEWPEKAPNIFPDDTLHIKIILLDDNTRKLSFNL